MKTKYKYLFFDLDGTLLHTLGDLTASLNYILEENGMPTHTEQAVRRMIGNGLVTLVTRVAPAETAEKTIESMVAAFRPYYAAHQADTTAPFPGVFEMLDRLLCAGCTLGVVSNKPHEAVEVLCESYFGGRFAIAIGERAGIPRKPAPDQLLAAMEAVGANPAETVYIGDGETDIATARAAGVDMISVLWGYRDKADLAAQGGFVFAETVSALESLLLEAKQ